MTQPGGGAASIDPTTFRSRLFLDQARRPQLGNSTVSITWMTPFDWNTFWIVTFDTLPLESQMLSVLPLASTVSQSPSTVLILAWPPAFLAASMRSLALM